jgi:hypothetical protein
MTTSALERARRESLGSHSVRLLILHCAASSGMRFRGIVVPCTCFSAVGRDCLRDHDTSCLRRAASRKGRRALHPPGRLGDRSPRNRPLQVARRINPNHDIAAARANLAQVAGVVDASDVLPHDALRLCVQILAGEVLYCSHRVSLLSEGQAASERTGPLQSLDRRPSASRPSSLARIEDGDRRGRGGASSRRCARLRRPDRGRAAGDVRRLPGSPRIKRNACARTSNVISARSKGASPMFADAPAPPDASIGAFSLTDRFRRERDKAIRERDELRAGLHALEREREVVRIAGNLGFLDPQDSWAHLKGGSLLEDDWSSPAKVRRALANARAPGAQGSSSARTGVRRPEELLQPAVRGGPGPT